MCSHKEFVFVSNLSHSHSHRMSFGKITLHLQYQTVCELSAVKEVLSVNPFKPGRLFVGHGQTAKPDQTLQNVASDKILHCLLTGISFKI